jgi:MFS family permease
VQDRLGLGEGLLGLALLGIPVGALLAQPPAGWLASARGSRPVTTAAMVAVAVAVPLPGLAGTLPALALSLALLGAATGALDVAMNVHGAEVERRLGRSIMSSLHAAYSIGALAGAANGALAVAAGVEPGPHLLATGAALALAGVPAARRLMQSGDGQAHAAGLGRPSRALLALGAMGFCIALVEGAALDWSAVYLSGPAGAPAALAGAGFVGFAAAWAGARLVGDRLIRRFGAPAVVRAGCAVAAAGFAAGLAAAGAAAGIVGFTVLGAGIGSVFPVVISAASRSGAMPSGLAIASVTTTAYVGFLAGPPLIGFLAEAAGLRAALVVLVPLCLGAALLAPHARAAGGAAPAER